jgi:peptide/nickel transport system substrate-binding protein
LTKNPDYWGYDERYPQNKLPYVSTVKYLIIVDGNTALAAMRTGKIDAQDALSRIQAAAMSKTNPEILQSAGLNNANTTMDPRNDTAPFNDIRVRQAMQKLIDIPLIASTYYGGRALSYPIALTCYAEAGWAWTYDQWPQDLKDEYKYDLAGAKKLLADAGLPNGFHTNLRVDNSADQDLVLLVQSAFASAGIVMDIIGMDSASWNSYVQVGKKHDQMCMRAGGSLGLSYEPLRQLYRFQTGYSTDYAMVSNASFDSYYPAFNNSTSIDQEKQIILAANQLVARQHFVITLPESFTYTLVQPWVVGFNNQGGVFSSGGTGPSCGNYLARFWINQKMKTAMGH